MADLFECARQRSLPLVSYPDGTPSPDPAAVAYLNALMAEGWTVNLAESLDPQTLESDGYGIDVWRPNRTPSDRPRANAWADSYGEAVDDVVRTLRTLEAERA